MRAVDRKQQCNFQWPKRSRALEGTIKGDFYQSKFLILVANVSTILVFRYPLFAGCLVPGTRPEEAVRRFSSHVTHKKLLD